MLKYTLTAAYFAAAITGRSFGWQCPRRRTLD